ncbi:MAG TPA: hypothetical protein VFE62_09690 [Gemmataceae bacterium]|nr:hypothetical protein [Gemmataceae bacterium]
MASIIKRNFEKELADLYRRLEAAYSAGGIAALEAMKTGEPGLLLSDKQFELSRVSERLGWHPRDEVGALRKQKLELEVNEIAGWMKSKEQSKEIER